MAPQTHLYTRPIRISRFIYFYWPLFFYYFFFVSSSFVRQPPQHKEHLCVAFQNPHFFLFVWIVTFYKSWQENILPLPNTTNTLNASKKWSNCYRRPCTMKNHDNRRYVNGRKRKKRTFGRCLGLGFIYFLCSVVDNLILPVIRIISFKWSI